ncbi:hypothetical protein [Herpetosiphon geysericola]|uniref:Peptidase M43 pregnancy-associated plasma-A domain-containing protein n=1 Tax=Herpetosiphon geysericola TaxID=70996 RepID=A0A0P6YGQ8_9CHLR|nr:hypothetical protein [Herpetosiphon geysericola]KPL91399.1 hypothetical protein SE18_01725 [Herpetosiphon geysericola]
MFWCKFSLVLISSLCLTLLMTPNQPNAANASSPFESIHLIVSLEWQPGQQDLLRPTEGSTCKDLTYTAMQDVLETALQETSQTLYQATQGQVWVEHYSVYTNGEHWNDADIRILVSNEYRPTAFLGGFEHSLRTINTQAGKVHFVPAAIMLGRLWNGINARCGLWSDVAGSQTISHELGHHILGLHDGYAPDLNTANYTYCSSTSNDLSAEMPRNRTNHNSLMSYHYSASNLRGISRTAYHCDQTPQDLMYGLNDWKTVEMLYGLVPSSTPSIMQPQGTAIVNFMPNSAKGSSSVVEYNGANDNQALGFSIKGDLASPQRIIDQGTLQANKQEAWLGIDTSAQDRGLILARDWHNKTVYSIYPNQNILAAKNDFNLVNQRWVANLQIKPMLNTNSTLPQINAVEVKGQECGVHGKKVNLAFCPAGGKCRTIAGLDISSTGSFGTTFQLRTDEIAGLASYHNYIYAYSSDFNTPIATWYQIVGGFGPATAEIHAPIADGGIGLDLQTHVADDITGTTIAVYQPAPLCTNLNNLQNYTIKQWPMLIQPYLIRDKRLLAWSGNQPPLYAQLSYDPSAFSSNGPTVLVYNPANPTAGWSVVPIVATSPELGLLTVDLRTYYNQGLVYALAE